MIILLRNLYVTNKTPQYRVISNVNYVVPMVDLYTMEVPII